MASNQVKVFALSLEQIEQLKAGHTINVNDAKLRLNTETRQVMRVVSKTSSKPRFDTFYAPNRSTTTVCVFSEADFKNAIAVYEKDGENCERILAYKRNGEKDANGNNVKLEQQIINGTAREVLFAVTRLVAKAFKVCGIASCYIDDDENVWYIRDDVEEVTKGLVASNWEEKEAVQVVRAVEDVTF